MNLQSSLSDLSQEAVAAFRQATSEGQGKPDALLKTTTAGITTGTGLIWFDLQVPAKNLFPVLTPLRNITPRVPGGGGTATNWRRVTAINALNQQPFVPEGYRGGVISTTADSKSATYKPLGYEDSVTIEAELAAVNFEDIRAMTAQRLLWATMIGEEVAMLGANNSVTLAKPVIGALVTAALGGAVAAGTYNVRVVALTLAGRQASAVNLAGCPGLVTVTNPNNYAFTFGGGASIKSDAVATGILGGATNLISGYCAPVSGALAYAWFLDLGAGGELYLQQITSINSFLQLTTPVNTTQPMATTFDADHSTNTYAYDGLLYQAYTSGSNAYIATQATGALGVGTPLTADGAGGIVELNSAFQSLWDNYRLGPSRLFVNSQEANNISKKILGTGAIYHFTTENPSASLSNLTGGGRVKVYINRFGMTGSVEVPIEIHPNLPAGTLVGYTERLPYPMPNVTNVAEVRLQRDYYQMEWPMRERRYDSGVYCNGVYAHYFPPSIMVVNNIGNG